MGNIWPVVAVLLVGCGGGNPTEREACMESGQAVCARAQTCGMLNPATETVDTCLTGFMGTCCQNGGSCENEARIDDQQLAECVAAIPSFSCQSLAQGAIPAACME